MREVMHGQLGFHKDECWGYLFQMQNNVGVALRPTYLSPAI
jgi:hypothetical protein